jgi:glyoxylase-like metal-dependent hydrolase (beta-lactamase superfamily II)
MRSGESLLIDTGLPGFHNREVCRIAEATKAAGLSKIDNLVITHYHRDHVGGVRQLAAKIPIINFLDHGPNVDEGRTAETLYKAYQEVASKGGRIRVNPGDRIPFNSLQVRVVAAGGAVLAEPLPSLRSKVTRTA